MSAQIHPFIPIVVNRPAKAVGPTLKVVALNAQGGRRLAGILECLRQPPLAGADVILLSEADWRHRRSAGREFAAELAAALELSFAYLGEFGTPRTDGEPITFKGNAILCSQPLHEALAIPIPNHFLHPRLYRLKGGPAGLTVRTTVKGKAIGLGVVHLNSRWDPAGRDWQMREYLAKLPQHGAMIIGGDLNTTTVGLQDRNAFFSLIYKLLRHPRRLSDPTRWEPLFARLEHAGFEFDGANATGKRTFTFSRWLPPFLRPNLDWIALRRLEPVDGSAAAVTARPGFFAGRVSDHDFVTCEVEL